MSLSGDSHDSSSYGDDMFLLHFIWTKCICLQTVHASKHVHEHMLSITPSRASQLVLMLPLSNCSNGIVCARLIFLAAVKS